MTGQNPILSNALPPGMTSPAGIGLRHVHAEELLQTTPRIGWLEAHPENYFGGGLNRHLLTELARHYPISLHAVGLSLGADHPVCRDHLNALRALADDVSPILISDHAAWSASGNAHFNDLLPLPYTAESLDRLCANIADVQDYLGRRILIENPSSYVAFSQNDMHEAEFLTRACHRTGCGLLLDVNNVFVQSHNHRFDPGDYLARIDPSLVGEIHIAGHTERSIGDQTLLIDTHNRPVRPEVWELCARALTLCGPVPTLIEWDQDIPPLSVLLDHAAQVESLIARTVRHAAA